MALIVSWNVAGWEATTRLIISHYGTLAAYLARHQVDVLCLQEVKVQRQKFSKDIKVPKMLGAHL